MAEFLENIERQLVFIVLQKLPVLSHKCCILLLVACGQSASRTLQQRFGNLPALDQLKVSTSVTLLGTPTVEKHAPAHARRSIGCKNGRFWSVQLYTEMARSRKIELLR